MGTDDITGDSLLYSTNENNVLQTENILDLTGSVIASKRFSPPESDENTNANQYYFYHYDVRGSVTNIIDPTGARVKGYSYNEFGNITDSTQNDFLKKQ